MTNQRNARGLDKRALKIQQLNDAFRQSLVGGRIILSQDVSALAPKDIDAILLKVSNFKSFSKDNDPYGEHDFGSFKHQDETIYFKIDYYAAGSKLTYGSEDPSDTKLTERVLTIMLSHEY
jgi:hypothetical protein